MRSALRVAMFGAGLCACAIAFAAGPAGVTVTMEKQAFVPAEISVEAGTRITWTNTDTMPHSVTANDKRFDSGPILPGKSFEWTAEGSGSLDYHCIFHPSMTAVVSIGTSAAKAAK